MNPPPAQPNQSLIDGLACLQWLASSNEPVMCSRLAEDMGLQPTRVNRLLKTLAHVGFAEQKARRYRCGPGVHVLAAQAVAGSGLLRRYAPALEQLEADFPVVALGLLWRGQVSYLYHSIPGQRGAAAVGRASLYPAADSGLGHVLLARLDDTDIAEHLSGVNDAARLSELLESIRQTRDRQYAKVSPQPPNDQNQTIAVALDDESAAAIGVSYKLNEIKLAADEVAARIRAAIARIGDP